MSELITLTKEEQQKAVSLSKVGMIGAGRGFNLTTEEECADLYRKAPEIASMAKQSLQDGLQGKALLEAKKLICGNEWNKPLHKTNPKSKNWSNFLLEVKCSKQQASYLLDFAGYKEVEEKLIKEGVEVKPIETASHFREAKKAALANAKEEGIELSSTDKHTETAKAFTEAVEANDGDVPKTAKEVKKVLKNFKNKVYSLDIYLKEFPDEVEPQVDNIIKFSGKLAANVPEVSEKEFKSFFKAAAKCLHPDKGGKDEDMNMLLKLKDFMEIIIDRNTKLGEREKFNSKYAKWCESKGHKPHDWVEDNET